MAGVTIASGVAERRIRFIGIKSLCHLNAFVWLAPAGVYLIFPFDFPILVNWPTVLPIIILTVVIPYAAALFGRVLTVRHRHFRESAVFRKSIFFASLLSPILLFTDLFAFRGLSPFGDIELNREIYIATAPSIVGYISLFGLAASLYLLTKRGKDFSRWSLLPWLANVIIFLLSGNRQYALLGIILLLYSRSIVRKKRITFLSVIFFFSAILVFAAAALALQFARQLSTEGRQTEFLYAISGIECHEWFCDSILEPVLLYIYGYFGNIYSGLTIALSDLTSAPLLSLTLPVFYRRFSTWADAPPQDMVMAKIADSIQAKYSIFPSFWSTMHSAAYYEMGLLGVALTLAFVLVFLTYTFTMWIKFGDSRYKSLACIGMAFLSVGVMYFPISEPVNFVLFMLIFCSLVFSPMRRVLKHMQ